MNWFSRTFGRRRGDAADGGIPMREAGFAGWRRAGAPILGDGTLPRFRGSATEQLTGLHASGPLGRARIRLRDAFTPSQPVVDPAMFAGRAALLTEVIRAVEDHRLHVVLFGDRGIGKTSLLHVLARVAGEARYLVTYTSCGEEADFGETFAAVAAQVPLLFHADTAPNDAETGRGATLADVLPKGALTPRQVSDLFARLTGTRLLIILDEFDRSPPGAFRRQVAELVKNLSDRSMRAQLVIAGVAANLTDLVEHIPSIRRNILGVPVPNMTAEEIAELIHKGEKVSGVTFDPAAIRMIISLATGSPYIAGLLGQHAGIAAVDRESTVVAAEDVARAIGRAADEIGDRISERSRFAIERAQADGVGEALPLLAHAALRNGGRFGEEALAGRADSAGGVLARIADGYALIERITDDAAGRYRFQEEGVPIYLWMSVARDDLAAS